ncbi:hypothetical protein D1114_20720 [Cereibacter sphaeroides]|uniref:Uncharacterized protein n=1 Tax=Cereibacter sphaeroides TaxID=1063 RepID=A0AAX1UFP7_CERSP|nr:hypothetical protein DWF04_23170 [Cereibacter sphaeroides f. sp. denitrificans]RHZ91184.1 hypothetical protein D1114_20720 [Cereibacter sphaeroides]
MPRQVFLCRRAHGGHPRFRIGRRSLAVDPMLQDCRARLRADRRHPSLRLHHWPAGTTSASWRSKSFIPFRAARDPRASAAALGRCRPVARRIGVLGPSPPEEARVTREAGTATGLALEIFSGGGALSGSVEMKGEAMIMVAAGDLLLPPLITIQTVEQAMRDRDGRGGPKDVAEYIRPRSPAGSRRISRSPCRSARAFPRLPAAHRAAG